jgi:two-component system, LytTR family, sensor kinase
LSAINDSFSGTNGICRLTGFFARNGVKEGNCCLPLSKAALTMHPFIFSNKIAPRLARHLAFWGIYFAGTLLLHLPDIRRWGLIDRDMLATAFADALSLLPIYLLAVYSAIYLILPIYLRKRKLSLFVWYALVLFMIAIPAGYTIIETKYMRRGYDSDVLDILSDALHSCMANLITIAVSAVIIKIMKDYWVRQRENELLAIENIQNKLHLLKMQMHPRILFASLQRIYFEIDGATREAPEMILKLSDLLSYLLYESESEQVPLSKELQMIENYLALKKLEYKKKIDIQLETSGQVHLVWITPGLFLPLLEIGIERSGAEIGIERSGPEIGIERSGAEIGIGPSRAVEQLTAVKVQLRAIGSTIYFRLTNNLPGMEIAKDPIVQKTLRTVNERLRSAYFQKCRLELQSATDSLSIVMELERNKRTI